MKNVRVRTIWLDYGMDDGDTEELKLHDNERVVGVDCLYTGYEGEPPVTVFYVATE